MTLGPVLFWAGVLFLGVVLIPIFAIVYSCRNFTRER